MKDEVPKGLASASPKGVTLPIRPLFDLVLVRDCDLAATLDDRQCGCLETCHLVLEEHGLTPLVHYAPDLSGALLYLPAEQVEEARQRLAVLFPFNCLDEED